MNDKTSARHGRAPLRAVAAWPLRRKLALALAIPMVLAATLGGLRVANDLNEARNSSTSATQVTVLGPLVDYLTAAEAAMVAAQDADSGAELEAAVEDLRSAADELENARDSADLNEEQRYQVDVVLDLSRAMREDTDGLSPGTWVAQLRQLQSGATQLITTIVNAQLEPEPRLELLSQTLAGRFSLAMQQALFATDRSGDTGSLELFAELGVEGAAIDRLASELGASEPVVATLRTDNAQRTRTVRTGGKDLGGPEAYAEYDQLVGSLMDGIDDELATAASDARARALANAALMLVALLAAILVAVVIARLLLRPIGRVRDGATAVAHEQLPEAVAKIRAGQDPGRIVPIDVTTDEEVGQLARAVDDLHRQAVLLASGEAELRSQVSDMFVTLSRRNTSLINQQLGLIETLEKNEEDPARLESLFRLDHLAARMRRTADSLLVLADAPTRTGVLEDVTVVDALQAAIAGVQDYERVRVGSASTARLADAAAGDVIHLLTELVDNALSYSPPTTTVSIGSTSTTNGVTIEVADAGLGIPDETLAALNETLSTGGDPTPETARRMGLFVVSRLAQRYDIKVSLRTNKDQGTTATVFLPNSLLRDLQRPDVPEQVAPVERPTPVAPTSASISTPAPERDTEDPIATITAFLALPRHDPRAAFANGTPQPGEGESKPLPVEAESEPPPPDVPEPDATPEPDPVPAGDSEVPIATINAFMALPRRQPGATFGAATAPPEDVESDPAPAVVEADPAPVAVESDPAPVEVESDPEPVVRSVPPPVVFQSDPLSADWDDLRRSAADKDDDSPIFAMLQSAWLTADGGNAEWRSSEVEAGWHRAATVEAPPTPAPVAASGLPMRDPGSRLIPGGVAKAGTPAARDPEAIRARLAALAAGVSRGRADAAARSSDESTEAGSP